jgi:hypothetical protein
VKNTEKLTQEALKSREEIRAVEATEVKNMGLTMTPEAHARGLILME